MDGNHGPEVAPAGHGDGGFGRAAGDAAAIPGTAEAAVERAGWPPDRWA